MNINLYIIFLLPKKKPTTPTLQCYTLSLTLIVYVYTMLTLILGHQPHKKYCSDTSSIFHFTHIDFFLSSMSISFFFVAAFIHNAGLYIYRRHIVFELEGKFEFFAKRRKPTIQLCYIFIYVYIHNVDNKKWSSQWIIRGK